MSRLVQFVCLTPGCTTSCVDYPDSRPRCNECEGVMISTPVLNRLARERDELRKALTLLTSEICPEGRRASVKDTDVVSAYWRDVKPAFDTLANLNKTDGE